MDEEWDDQHCFDESEEEIDGMDGNDLFPGKDNSDTRFVISWTKMKRNATQHNEFLQLYFELHNNYLSAAAILMGLLRVDCPQYLAEEMANSKTVQLQPLSINSLSKWPK